MWNYLPSSNLFSLNNTDIASPQEYVDLEEELYFYVKYLHKIA